MPIEDMEEEGLAKIPDLNIAYESCELKVFKTLFLFLSL